MRYISLFSGIEAASVAWEPLGFEPVAFAEVEPFPSAVLAARWPDVPNLGDVTKVDWKEWNGAADVVIGGSPCQSYSIAGLRKGLADPRGNLMLEFLRACFEVDPEWVVWENVPGVLSSNGGRDFQALLESVADLWPRGGGCWRVLDAQFFGVAQRRRRVFLVVNARDWRRALAVLQEPGGVLWDSTPGREKRKELARTAGYSPPCHLRGDASPRPPEHAGVAGFKYHQGSAAGSIGYQVEQAPTLSTDHMPAVLAFAQNTRDEVRLQGGGDVCGALSAQPGMKQQTYVMQTANTNANGLGVSDDAAYTLDLANSQCVCTQYGDVAGTLRARHDSSPTPDNGQNVVCCGVIPENAVNRPNSGGNGPAAYGPGEPSPTLRAAKDVPAVVCFNAGNANDVASVGEPQVEVSPTLRSSGSGTNQVPTVVCMADDAARAAVDVDLCGSLKVGGGDSRRVLASNGRDYVGALCARDFKGTGNQDIGEGKLICQRRGACCS